MTDRSSEAKHTPGPYHVEGGSIWAEAPDGSNIKIATTHAVLNYISMAERNANARLMAAAPELLDALKKIQQDIAATFECNTKDETDEETGRCSGDNCIRCFVDEMALSAIAKAEGRS